MALSQREPFIEARRFVDLTRAGAPESVPRGWLALSERHTFTPEQLQAAALELAAGRSAPPVLVSRGGRYLPASDEDALRLMASAALRDAQGAAKEIPARVIRAAHATDPRAFAVELQAALAERATDNGARVRRVLRDVIEAHGARSVDVVQGRAQAEVYEEKVQGILGAHADHSWHGRVRVSRERSVEAQVAMQAMARGQTESSIPRQSLNALRTFFHEEYHGASPISPGAYRTFGKGLEEAGTEILARDTAAKLLGVTTPSGGHPYALPTVRRSRSGEIVTFAANSSISSYNHYVEPLVAHTARAIDTPEDAPRRLVEAFRRLRSVDRPAISTPEAHLDALADALDLAGEARRRFVDAVASDRSLR
jgi:hypothetical protein